MHPFEKSGRALVDCVLPFGVSSDKDALIVTMFSVFTMLCQKARAKLLIREKCLQKDGHACGVVFTLKMVWAVRTLAVTFGVPVAKRGFGAIQQLDIPLLHTVVSKIISDRHFSEGN